MFCEEEATEGQGREIGFYFVERKLANCVWLDLTLRRSDRGSAAIKERHRGVRAGSRGSHGRMSASGGGRVHWDESATPTHRACHGHLVRFQLTGHKRGREISRQVPCDCRPQGSFASRLELFFFFFFQNTLFTRLRCGQEVGFEPEIQRRSRWESLRCECSRSL